MLYTARRTTVYRLVSVLALLCMPIPGSSSDVQGNHVALGFGSETCQTFLQAESNGLDVAYRHWVTGYLTAVNKLSPHTVDIRGTTDIDGMLVRITRYCAQHPRHSFSRAVKALVKTLYPKRMTHMPHP